MIKLIINARKDQAENATLFKFCTFDALGRIFWIVGDQLEPILPLHIVDPLHSCFVPII